MLFVRNACKTWPWTRYLGQFHISYPPLASFRSSVTSASFDITRTKEILPSRCRASKRRSAKECLEIFGIKDRETDRISRARVGPRSRCAMHHGKPVFVLLILLLPFGPPPIPPADHVASSERSVLHDLPFDITHRGKHFLRYACDTFVPRFVSPPE